MSNNPIKETYYFYVVGLKGDLKFLQQTLNLVRQPGAEFVAGLQMPAQFSKPSLDFLLHIYG